MLYRQNNGKILVMFRKMEVYVMQIWHNFSNIRNSRNIIKRGEKSKE